MKAVAETLGVSRSNLSNGWRDALSRVGATFTPTECSEYFAAAGYDPE